MRTQRFKLPQTLALKIQYHIKMFEDLKYDEAS